MKFDKGFATRLEFERSQAKLNESLANHASQTMNYEESLITLRNFIQYDIEASSLQAPEVLFATPHTFEQAKQEAFTIHPSIKTSDINIQVALNEYKRDQKRFHPKLDFVARYGSGDEIPGLEQPTNQYSVGLELRYNLYNGGKDVAANTKAQKYIDEKRILAERARQQIENRLRLAWNAYTLNNQKLPQMSSYTDSKKAVLETTMIEYNYGTADLNVLLNTEDEYIVAKKALIATQRDLQLARFRIREAMGDIVERIMLSDDTKVPAKATSSEGVADDVHKTLHLKPIYSMLDSQLLNLTDEPLNKTESTTQKRASQCFTSKTKTLNVRQEPTTQSSIVTKASRGETLCGELWQGVWLKVSNGWVSSEYLQPLMEASPQANNTQNNPEVSENTSFEPQKVATSKELEGYNKLNERCYTIKSKVLNVRKDPNSKSPIVARYTQDQSVCGTQWQGIWLKVSNGWVSNAYLQRIKTYAFNDSI